MRLGFWNRLALVSGALFSLTAASWNIMSSAANVADARQEGFRTCTNLMYTPNSNLTYDACREMWLEQPNSYGFTEWITLVGVYVVLSLIVYGLIWLFVQIAKWVLRGKATAQ